MKSATKLIVACIVLSTTVGCASGLNSMQEREYSAFEREGVLIEEKNPNTGVALGLLPGGGSFYAREPGLGVVNLLLWPLSVLWDPVSGSDGAKAINYDITKHHLKREKEKKLTFLDYQLVSNEINNKAYALEKHKIEQQYDYY